MSVIVSGIFILVISWFPLNASVPIAFIIRRFPSTNIVSGITTSPVFKITASCVSASITPFSTISLVRVIVRAIFKFFALSMDRPVFLSV